MIHQVMNVSAASSRSLRFVRQCRGTTFKWSECASLATVQDMASPRDVNVQVDHWLSKASLCAQGLVSSAAISGSCEEPLSCSVTGVASSPWKVRTWGDRGAAHCMYVSLERPHSSCAWALQYAGIANAGFCFRTRSHGTDIIARIISHLQPQREMPFLNHLQSPVQHLPLMFASSDKVWR